MRACALRPAETTLIRPSFRLWPECDQGCLANLSTSAQALVRAPRARTPLARQGTTRARPSIYLTGCPSC